MAGASIPTSEGVMLGDQLLGKFETAVRIAGAIGELNSWVLAGQTGAKVVASIQNDPTRRGVASGDLQDLLRDPVEQIAIEELTEEFSDLNLSRYLGAKAVVASQDRGNIIPYASANPMYFGYDGRSHVASSLRPRRKTALISAFRPAQSVIELGNSTRLGFVRSYLGNSRWDVHPFDRETGERVVTLDVLKLREPEPGVK